MLHTTLLPRIERCSISATMLHATKLLRIRMTHYAILLQAALLPGCESCLTYTGIVSLCLGGRSHEAYSNRACLCVSALVLKDGEESASGKCNIDRTR